MSPQLIRYAAIQLTADASHASRTLRLKEFSCAFWRLSAQPEGADGIHLVKNPLINVNENSQS